MQTFFKLHVFKFLMAEVKPISKIIEEVSPYYQKRAAKKAKGLISSIPEAEHTIIYDSSTETLEPVYFFILDLMNDFGLAPEKLIDNFTSTPGSGHFAELGQRATIMQQQAAKLLGDVNTVLRSVLNIIYDLKEFRIRLEHYKGLKSPNKEEKDSALLALKQIWMDKVDVAKGNSSIKAMGLGQAGFQTLIDAFLVAKDEKDVSKLDLNDRIKRILRPRILEFNSWVEQSEKELSKRYELERNYLKSQVNSIKLYSRWVKPYLKAASQLEQKEVGRNPALVKSFSTTLLELTLFGKTEIKNIPPELGKIKQKRKYYGCILVDFNFRGIPQRITQKGDYSFGGRTEVTFRAYALNEDEIKKIIDELDKADLEDVLGLIEGTTTESLNHLQKDIDEFLEEEEKEKEEKKKKKSTGSNPFSALIGSYDKPEKKRDKENKEKREDKDKPLRKDDWIERTHIRNLAVEKAKQTAFDLFDIYKKAHGMPSYS